MPEKLIAARGKISATSRGKASETEEQFLLRKAIWEREQKKILKWNSLYEQLGEERDEFINFIGDNEYLPEKVLGLASTLQRKLYILYLTTARLIAFLGMIDKNSPTYTMIKEFIINECPELYMDVLDLVSKNEVQQNYVFKNFAYFFGRKGISDLLNHLLVTDFSVDKQLKKWDMLSKKYGIDFVDFELIRVYRRFVDLNLLSEKEHYLAQRYIVEMSMPKLASILAEHTNKLEVVLLSGVNAEKGQVILKNIVKTITNNIQIKLENFLGDNNG